MLSEWMLGAIMALVQWLRHSTVQFNTELLFLSTPRLRLACAVFFHSPSPYCLGHPRCCCPCVRLGDNSISASPLTPAYVLASSRLLIGWGPWWYACLAGGMSGSALPWSAPPVVCPKSVLLSWKAPASPAPRCSCLLPAASSSILPCSVSSDYCGRSLQPLRDVSIR